MWLAAKYPKTVISLSLHSAWQKTDPFAKVVIQSWQVTAKALGSVPEFVIQSLFPWCFTQCFTPELHAAKLEFIQSLGDFVRSRPAQPVASFIQQSNAVMAHDAESQLSRISAPTLFTLGEHDILTSARFANHLKKVISNSELVIFDGCSHASLYEKVDEFNEKTLHFLSRHGGPHRSRMAAQ